MPEAEYLSPLMKQLKNKENLTLPLLKTEVPFIHAKTHAEQELPLTTDPQKKQQYINDIKKGEQAQERIIKASLTFITSLAKKEQYRRSQWGSSIPLEDIIQEGLTGLIKGINAYNLDVPQKSATNYLGQWITTQMRRGLENMEHSFTIPQETIERHRKIRAVRSRLESELGRTPTDQEIIDGINDSKGQYGDTKMGKVIKTPSTNTTRNITITHIQEERTYANRTGSILPTEQTYNEDTIDNIELTNAQSLSTTNQQTNESSHNIETLTSQTILNHLLQKTLTEINIAPIQEQIIKMKYGLPPYEEEQPIKTIINTTKIPKHRLKTIIEAFTQELTTPQSTFHKQIHEIYEDTYTLGIGWVNNTLGDYNPNKPPKPPNKTLTDPIKLKNTTKQNNNPYQHTYTCPKHKQFTISVEGTPNQYTICNIDGCTEIATIEQ